VGDTTARWRAPDGQQEHGVLTTLVAPSISGARAGARVQVGLTDSGQSKAQPLAAAESMFNSAMFAIGALIITAVALLICYWLARLMLDRRRLSRVDIRMVADRSTVDEPALTAGPSGTTDP
jgi:hypothetical protein